MSKAATRLPSDTTARLVADADRIARRLSRRLITEVPLPPEFRQTAYLRAVIAACHEGVRALLRQLHDGHPPSAQELALLGRAGMRQAEMQVPLTVLMSAYRLAARVVWREVIAEVARVENLPATTVVELSAEVLDYLDVISGAVGQAYLETREQLVRRRDQGRERVLQRLLAGDVSAELRQLALAYELALRPPWRVLAVATTRPVDVERTLATAWRRTGALLVSDGPERWVALVAAAADPGALWREALRTLGGGEDGGPPLHLGVGPVATTWEEVAGAARRAREALAVGPRLFPGRAVHDDREVGIFAAMAAAPAELRAYVDQVLGPLLRTEGRRGAVLLTTLETLLRSRGPADAAAVLGVHRHTVVYRAGRLRDLLGADLDDPGERCRLWLATVALRLLGDAD